MASAQTHMSMRRILVVDDETDIRSMVRRHLESEGYDVASAASAQEAFAHCERYGIPHLAVVDILMPEMTGLEFCRTMHEFSDLPVIFLTAVGDNQTVVQSLKEYAEDYMIKPFRLNELSARIERVLRRFSSFDYVSGASIRIHDELTIHLYQRRVQAAEKVVSLTQMETKILHILLCNAGTTVQTDYLLRRIWPDGSIFEDTLRVHVSNLRKKLGSRRGKREYILTERGIGYRFILPTREAGTQSH